MQRFQVLEDWDCGSGKNVVTKSSAYDIQIPVVSEDFRYSEPIAYTW